MSEPNYIHVTLVVDPAFGLRTKVQAEIGPLWVIDSPENVSAIKELWAAGKSPFANAPTCFNARKGAPPEEAASDFIDTVDEHHPAWHSFEVIGVRFTPKLAEAMRQYGLGDARETQTGFIFTREGNWTERDAEGRRYSVVR
jgi:hypothetical protein